MSDQRQKKVFTTGEVAQICKVSQQTVIRCFDNGRLQGFRVPGSKFRRIPRESLIAFMKHNQIPMDHLDTGRRRVLVVDDDEAIVDMFTDLLERDGRFEVKTASSGYDAGILTEQFRPDVLLLDYKLPDINGNVVCRTIRSNPNYRHMHIVIISGVADPDEIAELRAAGADDFIRKPFDINMVIGRIAELMRVA
ncbi:MAG: response regulator [Planctomycetes bacterium]|nr:response regulator [Planctomycetota bacterium]MBI3835071.1 response regulator [Planctomycetota bacterium]